MTRHRSSSVDIYKLRDVLSFDPDTGIFKWNISRGGLARCGSIAGSAPNKKDGYIRIAFDGTLYLAHRLAWTYVYGAMPSDEIDHINGIRCDNRIANLRNVVRTQNNYNRKRQSNNSSGYKGVSWVKRAQRWRAVLVCSGKQIHIGTYSDLDEARVAYANATLKYHGENSTLASRGYVDA